MKLTDLKVGTFYKFGNEDGELCLFLGICKDRNKYWRYRMLWLKTGEELRESVYVVCNHYYEI